MAQFYISSTKCAIQERQTKKNGKVYDVVFRIVTQSGEEKQKKLSGFKSKTLARQAHTDFITNYCEHIKNSGESPQGRTFTSPRTPWVVTISPASKNWSFIISLLKFTSWQTIDIGHRFAMTFHLETENAWRQASRIPVNPRFRP